jgi:hypothetical protein
MKRISDHAGILSSEMDFLRNLLQQWVPEAYDLDEKAQEKSLYAWLKLKLPDVPIKAQYGIAWGDADIVIQDEHLIELKVAFKPKSVTDFDRCLGQLWRYKEKWIEAKDGRRVWLVIAGESEAEFRLLLKKYIEALNGLFVLSSPFLWIEKRPVETLG